MFKWKPIAIFIICGGVFLSYMGYFDKPENCINEFVNAYNQQDVRRMIEMVDNPDVTKLKSTLSLTGSLSDVLLGVDINELLLDIMPISEDLFGVTGPRMYVEIQSSKMDFLRNNATVYTKVTNELNEESNVEFLKFQLKKKDRTWFITDVQEYY